MHTRPSLFVIPASGERPPVPVLTDLTLPRLSDHTEEVESDRRIAPGMRWRCFRHRKIAVGCRWAERAGSILLRAPAIRPVTAGIAPANPDPFQVPVHSRPDIGGGVADRQPAAAAVAVVRLRPVQQQV